MVKREIKRDGAEMTEKNYRELDAAYYMPAFSRDIMITRGSGSRVWDADGNEYIDCVAGIAVCSTGHCHPHVVEAIQKQAGELIHCSNLYYIPGQGELAKRLVGITGLGKAFFSNSGAEANEAAIKLALVRTGRKEFVSFIGGFHGRTCSSLACTHKPAIREPFMPLSPPCSYIPYGDLDALSRAVSDTTAAVFVEPIQGESGVIIPPPGFLKAVREVCDDHGALMIADEVQTGMGRTGRWLACEHERVVPDIVTLAKGIASGFPFGAIVAREGLAFGRSEHGSTFAGGPLACATALATLDVISDVLPLVEKKGDLFAGLFSDLAPRHRGLMIGITIGENCGAVQKACAERGVLVNCAADGNLRLVPPLTISEDEIRLAAGTIRDVIADICHV